MKTLYSTITDQSMGCGLKAEWDGDCVNINRQLYGNTVERIRLGLIEFKEIEKALKEERTQE